MISLLAVLVLGLIAGGVWHVWSRQQASRSWPEEEGYTYTVAGQIYRGTRIRYAHQGHRERSKAEAELAGYAPGRRVKVFHDPADPAQSVLVQG